ncbi:MAG: peptidoglycan editing factor PgeF [Pseudomonadota bacterium]|nr:peptidoglycan editing factor PgeF [Pseudomonadota bacterium]
MRTNQLPKSWIFPTWSAPMSVRAVTTSIESLQTDDPNPFNLATHVQDELSDVEHRRAVLAKGLGLQKPIAWLDQVHGQAVTNWQKATTAQANHAKSGQAAIAADACITDQRGSACVVMTADCLPILITDKLGRQVAAVHAGWRGLQQGVIEQTLARFEAAKEQLIAWIGPAISAEHYEVDDTVRQAFEAKYPQWVEASFAWTRRGEQGDHFLFDLPQMAEHVLNLNGVHAVFQSGVCTYAEPRLFSHRASIRLSRPVGRIATLIWKVDGCC